MKTYPDTYKAKEDSHFPIKTQNLSENVVKVEDLILSFKYGNLEKSVGGKRLLI